MTDGLTALRRARRRLERCSPHRWQILADRLECWRCGRRMTALDDCVKKAAVLNRLAASDDPRLDDARAVLFPHPIAAHPEEGP